MRVYTLALLAAIPASVTVYEQQFEVASIRPSAPGAAEQAKLGIRIDGAQVNCTSLNLKDYIGMAANVKLYQISGAAWLGSERFDINAKLPDGATGAQVPAMLQALLEERFQMKTHRETKELAVYALIVGKAAEYCHHLSENWRTASKKTSEFTLLDVVAVAYEVKQVIFFGSPVIQISGTPEAWVKGSKYELMRIFQNLLKNSIESGATRISTEFAVKGARVLVSVTDNGPGMDEDRVHRVMHGGFTSKENGTGLGLSICRHLTGAHGGEFSIESKAGMGTTVHISFPSAPKK